MAVILTQHEFIVIVGIMLSAFSIIIILSYELHRKFSSPLTSDSEDADLLFLWRMFLFSYTARQTIDMKALK